MTDGRNRCRPDRLGNGIEHQCQTSRMRLSNGQPDRLLDLPVFTAHSQPRRAAEPRKLTRQLRRAEPAQINRPLIRSKLDAAGAGVKHEDDASVRHLLFT